MVEIKLNDPVVNCYLFYVCVLVTKMMLTTFFNALAKARKKVVISPEGVNIIKWIRQKTTQVNEDEKDDENIRRAYQNDLENVPQFIFAGFVYILTRPDEMLAVNLFRIFTLLRFVYTIIYATWPTSTSVRAICFAISHVITYYMLLCGIMTFCKV